MPLRVLDPAPLFDEDALGSFLLDENIKPTHMKNIWKKILRSNGSNGTEKSDLSSDRNIPLVVRERLWDHFDVLTSQVVEVTTSSDKSTTKLIIQTQDGHLIESVIMRHVVTKADGTLHNIASAYGKRHHVTLCVSSQVGCAMGCTFCATGTLGLLANLTAGEILEQLVHANRYETITNVVFMGMGEPLNNYKALSTAVRSMIDNSLFGIAPSRVTVSTVGIIPNMLALSRDFPTVNLALSLHAPTQEVRKKIVPAARGFHIDKLMAALDEHLAMANKKREVLIEYILIDNVNDSDEMAHTLGGLLKGKAVKVNVIPYNPTSVNYDFKPPTRRRTLDFVAILNGDYNIVTLERREMGQDIEGACGQLAINGGNGLGGNAIRKAGGESACEGSSCQSSSTNSIANTATLDIEDLVNPTPTNLPSTTKRRKPVKFKQQATTSTSTTTNTSTGTTTSTSSNTTRSVAMTNETTIISSANHKNEKTKNHNPETIASSKGDSELDRVLFFGDRKSVV